MRSRVTRSTAIALASIGATLAAFSAAHADPVLNVQNLTFSTYTGSAPKNPFQTVSPTNWSGGGDLIFVDAPGTASSATGGYATYLPDNPPPGGNFVQADGNPDYESTFYQSISGLTAGTTYQLSFWQAASQQVGFSGPTTEQWVVSLGTQVLTDNCSSNPCTYSNPDGGASTTVSTLMSTSSQSYIDWEEVTVTVTADASTDILSFLAWGDNGNTTNLPPTVFLAGVNSPSLVPEPATLSLFGAGVFGFGYMRRRRAKRKVQA